MTTLNLLDVLEIEAKVKIGNLNLNAKEGFVFSQVDGAMTIADIKLISNLPGKEIFNILDRLVGIGALKIKGRSTSASEETPRRKYINADDDTFSFEDKVRSLYMNLERINYYELLETSPTATASEIKKAFYRMTKEFHPDRFFRGEDVEIRDRLQSIFAKVNEAYKLLMNPKKRQEYDKGVKINTEAVTVPRMTPSKPTEPSKPPRPIKPLEPQKPQMKNPFMDNILKAKRLYEDALMEMKRKNYVSARRNIRIAQSIDPYNKQYADTLQNLDKIESVEQAKNYHQKGLAHESEGRHKEAAKAYREAMLLDDGNPLYYTHLAKINLEHEKNLEVAKKLVKKAMELNAQDPELHLLLGRIFKEDRQPAAAISQFEKGLQIAPNHKQLAKELKKTKKGK